MVQMFLLFLPWNAAFLVALEAAQGEQALRDPLEEASSKYSLTLALEESRQRILYLESQVSQLQNKSLQCSDNSDAPRSHSTVLRVETERQLAQKDADDSSSSSSSGEHGSHGHQHDALVYLVLVLIIGTLILHLTTLPRFHKLPYTVVLFVLGIACSFVFHFFEEDPDQLGILARSYNMWMDIDPHLLIFTMLPVLLTGDAIYVDTSVAKRVFNQCLWLAGPGVLVGAFGAATFLWVYLQWEFLLCLSCGAILAATDPVAVVGLLKELGASPTLTVQIQGESLLNDGTAMVLFNVAYNMLKGTEHNTKSILILLVYMVGCSWFLGMVIGGAFSSWIKVAGNRLEHHSNMIQISLTICCAYGSFVFAEGVIGISGVLSTVATALVLADTIWPHIVSPEAMHEVWHTFEYIGNTVIFFLAGALSGQSMWLIDPIDYLHLLVIYVVLLIIRGSVLFGSRPILRLLSPDWTPVTVADAAVMTWGGLRGAVGLALAIQLMRDKAGGNITDAQASKVFFYTAGIACLTLIINATTCPSLVDWLGIASPCGCKTKVMLDVVERLAESSEDVDGQVKANIDHMLEEVRHHLMAADAHYKEPSEFARQLSPGLYDITCRPGIDIVADFNEAKAAFKDITELDRQLIGWDAKHPLLSQEAKIVELALEEPEDGKMIRTINEAFLQLVRAEIWAQIQRGEFVEGTRSTEVLLSSNTKAFQNAQQGLSDYQGITKLLHIVPLKEDEDIACDPADSQGPLRVSSRTLSRMGLAVDHDAGATNLRGRAKRLVKSVSFQGFIVSVILCNAVFIFLDPGAGHEDSLVFVAIDCCFMVVYLLEFFIKLEAMRKSYFMDAWNALDFICIVLGLFGIVTTLLVEAGVLKSNAISSEMLLIRMGRVFKLMRIMRVVVLVKFLRKMHAKFKKKRVSAELAIRLELIFTLRGFVQAHVKSHTKFLRYFGQQNQRCSCGNKLMPDSAFCRKCGKKRPDNMPAGSSSSITSTEHARCILESWTAIFKAAAVGSSEIAKVDGEGTWILEGLCTLRDTVNHTKDFTNFIVEAAHAGVLLEKDAENILHPMIEHLRRSDKLFADAAAGIHRNNLKRNSTGRRASSMIAHANTQVDMEMVTELSRKDSPNGGDEQDGGDIERVVSGNDDGSKPDLVVQAKDFDEYQGPRDFEI